jgi:hypothetical protein
VVSPISLEVSVDWRYKWHTMWTKILQLQSFCCPYGSDLLVVEINKFHIQYFETLDIGDAYLWPGDVTT